MDANTTGLREEIDMNKPQTFQLAVLAVAAIFAVLCLIGAFADVVRHLSHGGMTPGYILMWIICGIAGVVCGACIGLQDDDDPHLGFVLGIVVGALAGTIVGAIWTVALWIAICYVVFDMFLLPWARGARAVDPIHDPIDE